MPYKFRKIAHAVTQWSPAALAGFGSNCSDYYRAVAQ